MEQGAPGVTHPTSPWGDWRGQGLGCLKGGADKTLVRGAQRRRGWVAQSGIPQDWYGLWQRFCHWRGSVAGLGGHDLVCFTFFLAATNLLCQVSSNITGWGGKQGWGHISEHLQSPTRQLCH